jgi:hypothetical protein
MEDGCSSGCAAGYLDQRAGWSCGAVAWTQPRPVSRLLQTACGRTADVVRSISVCMSARARVTAGHPAAATLARRASQRSPRPTLSPPNLDRRVARTFRRGNNLTSQSQSMSMSKRAPNERASGPGPNKRGGPGLDATGLVSRRISSPRTATATPCLVSQAPRGMLN